MIRLSLPCQDRCSEYRDEQRLALRTVPFSHDRFPTNSVHPEATNSVYDLMKFNGNAPRCKGDQRHPDVPSMRSSNGQLLAANDLSICLSRFRSSSVRARRMAEGCKVATIGGNPSTLLDLPMRLRDPELGTKQRLSRNCSQANNQLETNRLQLCIQPWSAGSNLLRTWFLMDTEFPPRLPFEMFDT